MIELMEETANMLRGMCMDPRIPQDTKEALWSRVRKIDAATEAALGTEESTLSALAKARGALSNMMLEPHGCSLCDSGVPRNNAKGHQPDCPYVRAVEAMDAADAVLTPNV